MEQIIRRNDSENMKRHQDQPPPPPHQKCPRCDSSNTKFCYYNNYSLTQPRYFCKACRRYWTQGGTLRNVPIGGGCRKNKRPKTSTSSNTEVARTQQTTYTGMINSGTHHQSLRSLPPVIAAGAPLGNSIYGGGAILSSLAAMQALPAPSRMNQGHQFGANMTLLQEMNLQSLKPNQAQQFPAHDREFVTSQRPIFSSWTSQRFINGAGSVPSTFWTGFSHVDGGDQAGSSSSFNQNQWPSGNNHQGFNPSNQ